MNAVIYYSNTGGSKHIAKYLADASEFPLYDIYGLDEYEFDTVILVFPVHCQNIPDTVKELLSRIKVKALSVVATYGRMSFGNVLYEIQKRYAHKIIAAAYVPTKHSYLSENEFDDYESLNKLIEKLDSPTPIKIPKSFKNPLSNIFKDLRSRIGVKMYRDTACNNCGICETTCHNNAIHNGKPNKNCIRCLKCVNECPQKALHFKCRLPLRLYLKKKKKNKLVIYI